MLCQYGNTCGAHPGDPFAYRQALHDSLLPDFQGSLNHSGKHWSVPGKYANLTIATWKDDHFHIALKCQACGTCNREIEFFHSAEPVTSSIVPFM